MVVLIYLIATRDSPVSPKKTNSLILQLTPNTSTLVMSLITWRLTTKSLCFFFCVHQTHKGLQFVLQTLNENEPEKFQTHFSEYVKKGIEADEMEALYKKVHAAIRADPLAKKADKQSLKEHKRFNLKWLTYEERKANLIDRIRTLNSAGEAIHEEDNVW